MQILRNTDIEELINLGVLQIPFLGLFLFCPKTLQQRETFLLVQMEGVCLCGLEMKHKSWLKPWVEWGQVQHFSDNISWEPHLD